MNMKITITILITLISTITFAWLDGVSETAGGDLVNRIDSTTLPLPGSDEFRYDDETYENAINWYADYMTGEWDGWGKKMTATNYDTYIVERITLSFQTYNGETTPPEGADFDIALCNTLAGENKPDTDNCKWRETFDPPEFIEDYPEWSNFDYDVPDIIVNSEFWVLFLPGWGGEPIDPDPPFYFCIDEENWYERSFGNIEGLYDWVPLDSLGLHAEFGVGTVGTGCMCIKPASLGEIKSLYK